MRWDRSCFRMISACLLRTAVKLFLPGTHDVLNNTLAAAILHDGEEEVIPEERKAIFYAGAELAVRYFVLKPESFTNSRFTT